MPNIKTVSISSLPRHKPEWLTGDDLLPVVDVGTGINRSVTVKDLSESLFSVGEIKEFLSGAIVPDNFYECNGQNLSIGQFNRLYLYLYEAGLIIRTSLTTFQLPTLAHANANLKYYIYAGLPVDSTIVAGYSATNIYQLSNLNIPTVYNIPATNYGGSTTVLAPFLSAVITVPSNVFITNTNLTISLPNSSNSNLFYGNMNILNNLLYFSSTGSNDFGFTQTNVHQVQGATSFTGINNLSALSLLTHLPHLPFVITNNAAKTNTYNQYYYSKNLITLKAFKISIKVPAFEYTVNSSRYILKTFLVEKNNLDLTRHYVCSGSNLLSAFEYTKGKLNNLIEIIPLSSELVNTNLALHPTLSTILGTSSMRGTACINLTSMAALNNDGNYFGVIGELLDSFDNKPLYNSNPVKIDGKWGYPVDINDEFIKFILEAHKAEGFIFKNVFPRYRFIVDNVDYGYGIYAESQINDTFTTAPSAWGAVLDKFKFIPKELSIPGFTTITTAVTATGTASEKYLNITIPVDNIENKYILSYYTKV
jgi:hypothetical protein